MAGPRVHVVGAGMAGLGAAVHAAAAGAHVILHDAAARPGGRCRSFVATELDRTVDNGTHLFLGCNAAVFAYLKAIGADDGLVAVGSFPFLDLASGERWSVRPGTLTGLRAAGFTLADLTTLARLWWADETAVVSDCAGQRPRMYRRLWQPLTVSILNTEPEQAAAQLLWRVMAEAMLRGPAAARPYLARDSLDATFVAPALDFLGRTGGAVRPNRRLKKIDSDDGRVTALNFAEGMVPIGLGERVILALPPWSLGGILPGITVPDTFHSIVNAHFRLPEATAAAKPLLGLVGGTAQWVFVRGDVASVTVSAAESLSGLPTAEVADLLWSDASRALGLPPQPPPPWRVVKERRATIAHTPEQTRRRPGTETFLSNLWLAGDWTDTRLPCTVEGALRSGAASAKAALAAI